MAIYLSMQRVRFSSADGYEKFKVLFADVRNHLKQLPGFLHLTWWEHPDDPTWYNEVSMWTSKEALDDWHMSTYHKHAKEWAAGGAIMEDIITNFELRGTRLLRVCPCCGHFQDKPYELHQEQKTLAETCPKCEFHFPVMPETPSSMAVFKDVEVGGS
jgi:heme-degrading monooxygenase HmoA